MKRFVWRLQRVLDIKTKEEQIKKIELFKLTEKLAQAQNRLLRRQQILEELIDGINKKKSQQKLSEQEFFLKTSTTIDEQLKKLKAELNNLKLKRKQKTAEVLKVRRFREGLGKLREQAKRDFIVEQEKLEQKELDEIAGILFVRKMT